MSFNRKISIIQIVIYLIFAYRLSLISFPLVVLSPFILIVIMKVVQLATDKRKFVWVGAALNVAFTVHTAVYSNRMYYFAMFDKKDCALVLAMTIVVSILSIVLDIVVAKKSKSP